ncbi:ATP-dependent helicase [Allofrancisella guangzhouensis]|uniref:DNA 3'-5' helicase n=1 Tax=Allofrancisella guangzhouensis TaxID=594679 RepID=A0A0A8E4W8_9GAMM|nr:ATP-dependent helicase [Allofrancisella guangzhouensis]AJC49043.1 DNA helicase [Allofrancisella guangzhouensis]MBK2027467.1 ATP-dependent helicase [Allofrancisella guangzhouensis]MBK2044126.1 ATP-dependent helicase [Allofrancisella guangzhouensis]MBK2045445.1 ATP-dependent helicase [Allofrancisella guangzhouensis]
MQYTSEQQKIIQHDISSHALVSAVAGSGKTQTLIARIEYLLSKGVPADKILVLMYNKSAQLDFASRLKKILPTEKSEYINVRTLHSLGNSFLQAFAKAGYIKFDKILKDYEVDSILFNLIKSYQKEFKIIKEIDSDRVETFKEHISILKSDLCLNNKKLKSLNPKEKKLLDKVFVEFNKECEKLKAITYDDMIYLPAKFFEKNKTNISRANNLYSHIIIDEYQDINPIQQFFLKCLVGDNTYIMAVGDVDQTIYQWRGSTPYYMLEGFKKDFKKVEQYQLSYTFRYGDLISLMANNIITNNKKRHDNLCITYPKLDRTTNISILDNSDKTVLKLKSLIEAGVKASDIAILVRKYNSTTVFELSCLYNDLPYHVVADKDIFSENLFKAIYGYLMLLNKGCGFKKHAPDQRIGFIKAMFDYPSLYLKKDQKQTVAVKIAKNIDQATSLIIELSKNVDKSFKEKNILAVAHCWRTIFNNTRAKRPGKAIDFIFETLEIEKLISKVSTETYSNRSKLQIIEGIFSFAKSKKGAFNEFIDLLYKLYMKSIQQESKVIANSDQIQIMSMHRAKGLEWDYVVIHDATEGSFFGENNLKVSDEILEEERRLFYVAITRVKKHLFIVSADDIDKLYAWYKIKNNTYPKDLKCKNSLRFLYESNLAECENYLSSLNQLKKEDIKNRIFKKYHLSRDMSTQS